MNKDQNPATGGTRGSRVLRSAVMLSLVLLLLGSLFGILLTGPIVVQPPPLKTGAQADAGRLHESVLRLCGDFHPRDPRHPHNLDRTAEWIAAELRAAGLTVEFQDYAIRDGRFRNVVGYLQGTDPAAGAFVVGAHYDAFGGFPGADDNASGVAVLLELARSLPQRDVRAARYFVAFSTEEPPFFGTDDMGSAHFAAKLQAEAVDVELVLVLDMVGRYSNAKDSQEMPLPGLGLLYPRRGNFVAIVADLGSGDAIGRVKKAMLATETLPVHSFRAPAFIQLVHMSDHLAFRKLGLPAVQITDTGFMRVPEYHTPDDTPEKLDYPRMALLVEALHGVLWDPKAH